MLVRLRGWLRALVRHRAVEREMREEMQLHLEQAAERLMQRGMDAAEARATAAREFGNVAVIEENARDARGVRWITDAVQDARYALRGITKAPGLAAVVFLTLGFGIAATTALFSVVDALDLRPLPFADSKRLVWLSEVSPPDYRGCERCPSESSEATMIDWLAQTRSYAELGAVGFGSFSWQHDDQIELPRTARATPNLFSLLKIAPARGRVFVSDDTLATAARVVVVSYGFWQSRLGGRSDVVGTTLVEHVGDGSGGSARPVTIVGVLPQDFRFADNFDLWTPFVPHGTSRSQRSVLVVGRLAASVEIASANAELAAITARLTREHPKEYRNWGVRVQPLRVLLSAGSGRGRYVLFAITIVVLCIGVFNVAGLLLARTMARRQEFAVRSALGAGGGRLAQQLLVEGAVFGLGGGVIGVVGAYWGVRFAGQWFSLQNSGLTLSLDFGLLAFALALSLCVGIGACVWPAIRVARESSRGNQATRVTTADDRREARGASNVLIVAQIALGLLLLTSASLLSTDFLRLRYLDLGYEPTGLYRTSLRGTPGKVPDATAWILNAEAVRQRIAGMSGVLAASLEYQSAIHPQIVRTESSTSTDEAAVSPTVKAVDPDYFKALGMRVVSGRSFAYSDRRGSEPVGVVNASAAAILWPGQSPLGRRIVLGDSGGPAETISVVGVAADVERGEMVSRHWPVVYRPLAQAGVYHAAAALYVRRAPDAPGVLAAAQAVIREETGRTVEAFAPDDETLSGRFASHRLTALALDLFAAFGLTLAGLGVYGTIAYSVTQRTREIGVRVALGAQRASILRAIAGDGVRLSITGILLGAAGAFVLSRLLRPFVVTTTVTNPWVFAGSIVAMLVVGIAAAVLPARRALRIDPAVALRGGS